MENIDGEILIPAEEVDVITEPVENDAIEEKREATLQEKRLIWGYMVYRNLIENGRIYNGKEKRRLRRECERNALKGRYDRLFDEEALKRRAEKSRESFENLNDSAK